MLSLIEVNRRSLPESLSLLLKHEYGCHRRDMYKTELCLSQQMESSESAYVIIEELHQLEPKNKCQIFVIWLILFMTSLFPNLSLGLMDIWADAQLSREYYRQMQNTTYNDELNKNCTNLTVDPANYTLEAYSTCLNTQSKFFYTTIPLAVCFIFNLIEFLVLESEYESTGLRKKILVSCTQF